MPIIDLGSVRATNKRRPSALATDILNTMLLSGPRDQALIRVRGSDMEGSEAGSKECRNAGMQE